MCCGIEDEKRNPCTPMCVPEDTRVTKLDEVSDMMLVEAFNVIPAVVDDPYVMGKIAYAVALNGIYSLGVTRCSSTRLVLGVSDDMKDNERKTVVSRTAQGYKDTAETEDTFVGDCRVFRNPWCLFGGTATVLCHPYEIVQPVDATIGDVIVLTKPLGTAVALTASEWMRQPEKRCKLMLTISEESVERARSRAVDCMMRTNRVAAMLMRKYNAHAACEVGPYGILGHADLLARRQANDVSFTIHNMPMIARISATARITGSALPLLKGEMPEVSGGLLVVLPREQAAAYCKILEKIEHRQAWIVGIVESGDRTARVIERPRVIEVPAKDNGVSLW
ncbi:inactive selenide, water dikinase-like protein [Monomorium pharaonis]|uniref:inactive selenide, water dikinase-like protein n=1 Tax=Monomorium pharaonis TaxID=307658 RepID=UPI001746AD5E|nr:inactive selenide, water dikinase-like protein [Monomorium pharaonis]